MIFRRRIMFIFVLLVLITVSACFLFIGNKHAIEDFENNDGYWNWLETPSMELILII